ncbi:MAG: ParB/RepB/Spo0J family partition protein [Lachnospiraceae bacterium]|nr:ParB/RepB/Spo0J family partition protein [Lachnospiraceae bacterium]
MSRTTPRFELSGIDELFGIGGGEAQVIEVPLEELHGFRNHPFLVREDEDMLELITSIRDRGVLVPGVVRPASEGGYEIIAGHRRKYACEKLGIKTMPVIVNEYDDDEATIAMVESNYQRKRLLPSEKAKSFAMKYEALKHQGRKEEIGNTADWVAKAEGRSGRTIQRYIRLTHLLPEFLDMVDRKEIGIAQGGMLAALDPDQQKTVYEVVREQERPLTNEKVVKIADCAPMGLNKAAVEEIMKKEPECRRRIMLDAETVRQILGEQLIDREILSNKTMINRIYSILREWVEVQKADGSEV